MDSDSLVVDRVRAWGSLELTVSDLPCVSGIQAEEGRSLTCSHTRICGPQGSAVDFSCTLPNPDRKQKAFWVAASERGTVDLRTAQLDSQRVQHHCSEDKCTLKIQDLRKDDSATYRVRVKPEQSSVSTDSAGVLLLVTGARFPQRLFYHLCASVSDTIFLFLLHTSRPAGAEIWLL